MSACRRAFRANGHEADPAAGEARQRKAIEAEIEIVLERGGIDHGDQRRREHLLALMCQRRGLAAVIVAGERQHAAIERGAGRVGMLERIDRAIDARPLPVPDAEHAIDLGAGKQADLLAALDRGCRQVLVQAGDEGDVVLLDGPSRNLYLHAPNRDPPYRIADATVVALNGCGGRI
jgi:hypothetical protein